MYDKDTACRVLTSHYVAKGQLRRVPVREPTTALAKAGSRSPYYEASATFEEDTYHLVT